MSALRIRAANWAGKERLRNRLVGLQAAHSSEPEYQHLESTVDRGRDTCESVVPLPL
jgi:hypothetical protein